MSQRLVPKTISLSCKRAVWGDGESHGSELGVTFQVPDGCKTLKELTLEVFREQFTLEMQVINNLMLREGIPRSEAKRLKTSLATKYKAFLTTPGEEDE